MASLDADLENSNKRSKKIRGIFTLILLACAAAAGGCYFAAVLH